MNDGKVRLDLTRLWWFRLNKVLRFSKMIVPQLFEESLISSFGKHRFFFEDGHNSHGLEIFDKKLGRISHNSHHSINCVQAIHGTQGAGRSEKEKAINSAQKGISLCCFPQSINGTEHNKKTIAATLPYHHHYYLSII